MTARPLPVLYLTDVCFPRVNGVSTSIATFRRELPAFGVEARLVGPAYGRGTSHRDMIRLPGWRVPFDREDRWVPAGRMVRCARRLDFDLVHVQTPFSAHAAGVRLARSRGVPLVETWHTDFESYLEHYLPLLPARVSRAVARWVARRSGREADRIVVPSAAVDVALRDLGIRTPRAVIPTGLALGELGRGDGERFRRAHGIDPARRVAVHIGRVAHEKNIGLLLEVAARVRRIIPDFLLIIAGEGPARTELVRRGRELGLEQNLLFVGYLERGSELADCYRAGDCFVFASRTETQGLVLLEAMSLAVPVVAIAERGTVDLLSAGRAALVARNDADEFAAAVVRLLGDDELRGRLAAEGPGLAAEWSAGSSAKRLAELYRSLVATVPTGRPVTAPSPSRARLEEE